MVDSVEETEVSQNENTNKEPESGKAKASSTPGNPAAQAGGSSAFGGQFSTIFGGGPSFVPPVATPVTGLSQSLPACLMPEPFNGSGDFEDYLGQFNTAAYLSGWYRPCSHDYRPQYFALRLKGNALHFYSTLSEDHQDDFNPLVEAFRQNYTTNVEILKARLKAARQQPGQDIATFLCDIRTLARRAYRDHPRLLEQIVVTSFIEGLNNSTLRWELRKLKPENADHALTKALELQAYLELEGRNPIGTASSGSAGVNHMTNQFLTENTAISNGFVRSLKKDTDNMPHSRNRGSRDNSRNRERDRNSSLAGEPKMTHRKTQEADTKTTHGITETHTCLRAIDRTNAMIHASDMDKDTILVNVGLNKTDRFNLSHLAMTGDKTGKTSTSTAEMHKTGHNHHTKTDDMTLTILDDKATVTQPGPKTRHANIANELIILLANVKLVLIA